MDLAQYVSDLRQQLEIAADAGGDQARQLASRLTAPLEAATRLVLLEALSNAAGEITRELAPGSVEVRLRGRDPEFVVTKIDSAAFEETSETSAPATAVDVDANDVSTSRTTLRLPDQVKVRVEAAAAAEGVSVNTWLVRAVTAALEPRPRRAPSRETRVGERFTGWVR